MWLYLASSCYDETFQRQTNHVLSVWRCVQAMQMLNATVCLQHGAPHGSVTPTAMYIFRLCQGKNSAIWADNYRYPSDIDMTVALSNPSHWVFSASGCRSTYGVDEIHYHIEHSRTLEPIHIDALVFIIHSSFSISKHRLKPGNSGGRIPLLSAEGRRSTYPLRCPVKGFLATLKASAVGDFCVHRLHLEDFYESQKLYKHFRSKCKWWRISSSAQTLPIMFGVCSQSRPTIETDRRDCYIDSPHPLMALFERSGIIFPIVQLDLVVRLSREQILEV